MENKKRKRDGRMKRAIRGCLLVALVLTMMVAACGGEEDADYDVDINLVETEMNDGGAEEEETQYLEVESLYTAEEEIVTEEVVTEESTTEESTSEELTTEEPTTSAPVVEAVDVTVSGTHYVGDDLSAADFTVVVTMSDGSTMTNPAGWAADRLHLSEAETQITVTYQGVATIITVYATERPTEAPTETPTKANEMDYVLNKNTKKFHYPGCKSVKQMKESNKIYFTGTREEAIGKGYKPCGNCNP